MNLEYGPIVDTDTLEKWKNKEIEIDNVNFIADPNGIEKEYIKWAKKQYDYNDEDQIIVQGRRIVVS